MKKNNILPIFIIFIELLLILSVRDIIKKRVNNQIILYNTIPTSKHKNRRIKSYNRKIFTRRSGRNIYPNSSNDEILELIQQFLEEGKNDTK